MDFVKIEQYQNEAFEKRNNIVVSLHVKSSETHFFVSKHFDIMSFNSYMENHNLYQVCAYSGDDLVGVSIFKMADGKIHLNYGCVSETYRNCGINKKMKNAIIQYAKSRSCTLITSNVRQSNISSLKSLQSLGFEINNNYDLYYSDGEKKIPLYLNL